MDFIKYRFLIAVLILLPGLGLAQDFLSGATVTGNTQVDAQLYTEDKELGITDSTLNYKKFGMNGFANINYTNGNFNAGIRFEGFLNPMVGFDPRYEGVGIPYWFASYKLSKLEFTAGHFYEQFGSGLILRSWEEWTLGYDNNIYGFNAKFSPVKGVTLKGLVGVQRFFWEPYEESDRGIVRGADGDFYLNDMFESLNDARTKVTLGGSFVSRYEPSESKIFTRTSVFDSINQFGDTTTWQRRTTYQYNLPANVGSWAARFNIANGGVNFYAEYAEKGRDPNQTNDYIYKKGRALYSTLSYSTKGLGIFLSAKWIDNMSFKSKRNEAGTPPMLDINYLPSISKEHQYSLASMYPYATKQNGEFGLQGEVVYTAPRKSALGGKYGTTFTVNYSIANNIDKQPVSEDIPIDSSGTEGYKTNFFSIGDLTFYRDLNLLVEKKFSTKVKMKAAYFYQVYNQLVIEDDIYSYGNTVFANIGVIDFTYKFDRRNSLRTELQALFTEQDEGDWAGLLLEYNISPTWFFSVADEYNYGAPEGMEKLHYYNASFGYTDKSNRISLRYGRQREGLLCVGGVCRFVPASTGLTLT
ncbi:MAG: hypothetical protein KDC05_01205, partial [Bacteroidales bacterium]|nr:hypothetical protein [Bacteroidales bacterium]